MNAETERENIDRGLSQAAWGYFFLNFNLNINHVNVLPQFVGYLLFPSAIGKLSGERRDLNLLWPLAVVLGVWAALDWPLSWFGLSVSGHILFLDLLISVAGLYFQFQFLTDMAALAERYQPQGNDLDQRLRRRRTVYIVLVTAFELAGDVPAGLLGNWRQWMMTGVAVTAFIASLLIMTGLFELRRCFREGQAAA